MLTVCKGPVRQRSTTTYDYLRSAKVVQSWVVAGNRTIWETWSCDSCKGYSIFKCSGGGGERIKFQTPSPTPFTQQDLPPPLTETPHPSAHPWQTPAPPDQNFRPPLHNKSFESSPLVHF